MRKCRCSYWRCAWCGDESAVLKAPHPFEPGDEQWFCPECKDTTIVTACDEPGCEEIASCGFPVEDERGYRQTCYEHSCMKRRATSTVTGEQK